MNDLIHIAEKAALSGVSTVIVSNCCGTVFESINFPSYGNISYNTFMFGVGAGTSIITDTFHKITSSIPIVDKILDKETAIVNAAIAAGVLCVTFYCIDPDVLNNFGLAKTAMVGAGGEIASQFAYNIIKNIL